MRPRGLCKMTTKNFSGKQIVISPEGLSVRTRVWGGGGGGRLCLKERGTLGAIPQQLQSGCRGLRARFGGGYCRFEMRLRLVLGNANAFGVALWPEPGEGGLHWGGGTALGCASVVAWGPPGAPRRAQAQAKPPRAPPTLRCHLAGLESGQGSGRFSPRISGLDPSRPPPPPRPLDTDACARPVPSGTKAEVHSKSQREKLFSDMSWAPFAGANKMADVPALFRVLLKGGGGVAWNPKVQKYGYQKQPNQYFFL